MQTRRELLARRSLILPRRLRRRLDEVGIHARSNVSLEHQHLANRYVVRGVESGGAIAEMGRYVTFAGENGEPLAYLQPIDTLGSTAFMPWWWLHSLSESNCFEPGGPISS